MNLAKHIPSQGRGPAHLCLWPNNSRLCIFPLKQTSLFVRYNTTSNRVLPSLPRVLAGTCPLLPVVRDQFFRGLGSGRRPGAGLQGWHTSLAACCVLANNIPATRLLVEATDSGCRLTWHLYTHVTLTGTPNRLHPNRKDLEQWPKGFKSQLSDPVTSQGKTSHPCFLYVKKLVFKLWTLHLNCRTLSTSRVRPLTSYS